MPESDAPDQEFSDEVAREENVKHLEMIQAVIARLGGNSFLIKAWAVTAAAAAYGIAVNRIDWRVGLIGILIVLGFWVLDSYYLRQERLFRLHYDYVRSDVRAVPRFSMSTTRFNSRVRRRAVLFSTSLVTLYGTLVVVGLALGAITAFTSP